MTGEEYDETYETSHGHLRREDRYPLRVFLCRECTNLASTGQYLQLREFRADDYCCPHHWRSWFS